MGMAVGKEIHESLCNKCRDYSAFKILCLNAWKGWEKCERCQNRRSHGLQLNIEPSEEELGVIIATNNTEVFCVEFGVLKAVVKKSPVFCLIPASC
jgi:hypothetical protein